MAAVERHDGVVKILLEGGADVNAKDNRDQTPLHRAAIWGQDGVVKILVEGGADVNTKDNTGMTPLDYANDDLKASIKKIQKMVKEQEKELKAAFPRIADREVFETLLRKGFYLSYNNRIYLAGACNVGKSTLAGILIGETISKDWISTDGLKIYYGRNGIHLKKKEMVVLSKALKDSSILATVLLGQPSLEEKIERKKGVIRVLKGLFKRKGQTENIPESAVLPQQTSEIDSQTISQEVRQNASREPTPSTKPTRQKDLAMKYKSKPLKQSHGNIHRDLTDEIKSGKYKVQIAPSDLVDFGGQRAYDLTHQLFIQQKGAFVLLLDGRKELDDVLSEYFDERMTTRIILVHWVNSILTYCSVEDDGIYPVILFALTHKDELTKEEQHKQSRDVTKQLTEMFSSHEHSKRIRFQQLFLINATDSNDSGVLSLKECLVNFAFQQEAWGEKMPIAWVPLELQLAELRSSGIFIISLDDIYDLNMNNDELCLPDKELKHFLRCQHSLGKLMYFDSHGLDKFVIVQPTALVDILRSFITDKLFWPKDPSLHSVLSTLHDSGFIKKSELFQLWSQDEFNHHLPNEELKEFMANVLVHLDILVEPKRFSTSEEVIALSFIVPCMVNKPFISTQFPYRTNNDKTIVLSYRIKKSTIPNAMVYKLIGAVLNIWPIKRTPEQFFLFDKSAVLEVDHDNDLYITFEENRVIICLTNSKSKYFISPDIASVIQEFISLTVTNVIEFYRITFGKSHSKEEPKQFFEMEVGEICEKGMCFTSLTEIKNKDSWTCENQKQHYTKFPLYWLFDKKLPLCPTDCSGLDQKVLDMVPENKHLMRLLAYIGREFYEIIIHLGLTVVEWQEIEDNTNYSDRLTQKFVGLCKWKKNKHAMSCLPTFRDLSKVLAGINYSEHFLCQVFRQKLTGVYALDNPRLNEVPEDDVLKELSDKYIGPYTLPLGVELGLDMNSIDETVFGYPKDMKGQTYDILQKWKSTSNVKPTIRWLMLALQYVDPRGFHFLQQHYAPASSKT